MHRQFCLRRLFIRSRKIRPKRTVGGKQGSFYLSHEIPLDISWTVYDFWIGHSSTWIEFRFDQIIISIDLSSGTRLYFDHTPRGRESICPHWKVTNPSGLPDSWGFYKDSYWSSLGAVTNNSPPQSRALCRYSCKTISKQDIFSRVGSLLNK